MLTTAPTLSIAPEKVSFFINQAREFDGDDTVIDSGSIVPGQAMGGLLNGAAGSTFEELSSFINALKEDERIDLVALMWLGRGDGTLSEWDDLREEADRLHNKRTAAYLLARPNLSDHLEEGLSMFGVS